MGSVYSMISNMKLLTPKIMSNKKNNNKYEKIKKNNSIESNNLIESNNSIESNNLINESTSALDSLNLTYKVYSPDNKEEYNKFYETMMGMFRVDKNGNKITPKYTYEEGINKIFNNNK